MAISKPSMQTSFVWCPERFGLDSRRGPAFLLDQIAAQSLARHGFSSKIGHARSIREGQRAKGLDQNGRWRGGSVVAVDPGKSMRTRIRHFLARSLGQQAAKYLRLSRDGLQHCSNGNGCRCFTGKEIVGSTRHEHERAARPAKSYLISNAN